MAPTLALLPLLLLPYTLALCPTVTCAELPPNVCAMQLSESEFQINANGCEDNYACHLPSFMDWESLARLSTLSFSCVPETVLQSANDTAVWISGGCQERKYKKDFAGGQVVVLCEDDTDCLLQDGTYESNACICVPRSDAKGVCQPSPSNQALFSQYWVDCGKYGAHSLTDEGEYLYFEMAFQYWVYEQTDITCFETFAELQTLRDLRDDFSWAAAVAASGLLFVY